MVNGVLAMAQPPESSFNNQQQTSGVVTLGPGQTARLNVLYPTVPAPLLLVHCSANLAIIPSRGSNDKSENVPDVSPGKTVSLDLNADTDLTGAAPAQVYGISITPGCRLITTLEIIDNATQKTVVVVGSETTYPFSPQAHALAPATPRAP
jgi:hypothetical protein